MKKSQNILVKNEKESFMEYVRVYELAKKYGLTNEQMINFLIDNGIDVVSHMSSVKMSSVSQLMKLLEGKKNFHEHTNK